jgi:hypothetical protein
MYINLGRICFYKKHITGAEKSLQWGG